jgi:hypothetical protein
VRQCGQLAELVGQQPSPGTSDLVTRSDSAEQSLALGGGLLHWYRTGQQLTEEAVGPAQALDVGAG